MNRAIIFISILVLPAFSACSQDGRVENRAFGLLLSTLLDHSVDEMDVGDVDDAKRYHFVDARERAEFEVSHIEGAVWVGYDDYDPSRHAGLEPGDSIIVYCSVGYRSEKIAEKLAEAGLGPVYNLYGGIFEWKNQGRQVVGPDGEPTQRVHAYDRNWGRWLQAGEKVYE